MIDLAAYVLEPLHQEGACLLSRGQLRGQRAGMVPSLLVVAPVGDHPAPASLRRLEHEYALRAALDPAWAVRPLALVQHQGRPVLVLADPGGEPLTRLLSRPLAVPQGLRVAIGLAVALGQLHGRGLIHKDIKPANVLVERGDRPGLAHGIRHRVATAARAPGARAARSHRGNARLHGAGADRADESVDRRPQRPLRARRHALRNARPAVCRSPRPIRWNGCTATSRGGRCRRPSGWTSIPDAVSAIVMKLLAKTAEDRYQTAAGVERDLRRCLAQWEADGRIDAFPLGRTRHARPAGHSRKAVWARARDRDPARRLRARGDERDAGAGARFRLFRASASHRW